MRMTNSLTWLLFGLALAQTHRASASNRIFYDLTWADVIRKSEKCSRCAPTRPCLVEWMPKLPVTNNYDLEFAEFITDDELNAKYTGQDNFCDCTPDLWGGVHWKETKEKGCGMLVNNHCKEPNICSAAGRECFTYPNSFYCKCDVSKGEFGQLCNLPVDKKKVGAFGRAPFAFNYKPKMTPFMTTPTFAPYQSDHIRGMIIVNDETIKVPPDWPEQENDYEDMEDPSKRGTDIRPLGVGWCNCFYYNLGDGRNFCGSLNFWEDPTIWYKNAKPWSYLQVTYPRDECLKDLEKKIHYTDKQLCELIPAGEAPAVFLSFDYWFRVDLDPNSPDVIMVPGDPLPIGRRFQMRIALQNTVCHINRKGFTLPPFQSELRKWRVISWRLNSAPLENSMPNPYAALYQLQFRQCTYIFTYTGCSSDQSTQPHYRQDKEIVITSHRRQHPGTKGCETMKIVDNRWTVEWGEQDDINHPDMRSWTFNAEPYPYQKSLGRGIGETGTSIRVTWKEIDTIYDYNGINLNMVVVHDFVQQGHPRRYISTDVGLEYSTRQLCYFEWVYIHEIIKPESEFISQNCDDSNGLQLKITRPFYFYEHIVIEWWCVNPKNPNDPCTQVQKTESLENKFDSYEDFVYMGPMECTNYVWAMKVDYLTSNHTRQYQYQINIARSREAIPNIIMESLSVDLDLNLVNPDEPNYFRIVMDPHKPDIWSWVLYDNIKREPTTGAISKKPVEFEWRQPLTSTYIGIIPPDKLKQDDEYILLSNSKHGRASFSFIANSPPKPGLDGKDCIIAPNSGIVGRTEFQIDCANFTDKQTPLSYKVVESKDVDEMPWLQYKSFSSGTGISSKVSVFHSDVAVLIFDSEGMHKRIQLSVDLKEDPSKQFQDEFPDFLANLPDQAESDKLTAVEEMARFTQYFARLKLPFEEYQKLGLISALSQAVNEYSEANVFMRGAVILKNLFLNQLEKQRLITDTVLLAGGEQLHNFADLFSNKNVLQNLLYYDQKQLRMIFIAIAGLILVQPDPIVINDTIREDEHEAHKIRASKGSYNALHALEKVGLQIREKQYFQLQPTYSTTRENITLRVQVNNASTFNTEFSPYKIHGHTMTVSQETIDKYQGKAIFSTMITSEQNLFWWVENDAGILSVIAEVDEGTLHKSSNYTRADGPFNIYLKLKNFKEKTAEVSASLKPPPICESATKTARMPSVHHFKLPEGEGVFYLEFEPDSINTVKVLISANERPTYDEINKMPFLDSKVIATNFSNSDSRNHSDLYVAVLYPVRGVSFPYFLKYKVVQCVNYIYKKFEARGCRYRQFLENQTDTPRIWCECSHLSWFSAKISKPLAKAILGEDTKLYTPTYYNYIVPFVVAFVWLFFFLLLVWGRHKDKLDENSQFLLVLNDNWCTDTYPYVVAVFTGERWGSGTSSWVSIRVFGKDGHSRVHTLYSKFKRVLKNGQDDWFLMKTAQPLGKLTSIQLWHSHSGLSPEWYCQKVVIYDVKTEETYTFIVERWFTFDSRLTLDEARMDEVKTLKPEDVYSKWQYHIAGWIYSEFREKYIWASIISRHPRSLYTRCQRSVLAIGLVMTAMGFSMLFFKFDSGPADYTSFNFTLEDWWNGIKCILIAKLIFVVGFCFRMSKKTKSDELKKREKQRLEKLEKAENKRKPKSRGVYVKHRMMMIMPAPNPKEPVAWKHRPPKKKKDKTSDKSAEEKVVAGQVRHLEKTDLAKKFWYLAWILSIIIISVSSIVIVLLGIRFGKKKSLVWIATFVSGIVTDSLFFQPVKCIVFAILFSLILKRSNTDLTVMEIRYDDVTKEKSSNFDWNHCLKKMWHTRMTKPYHPALTSRILKVRALYGSRRAWYIVYYVVTLLLLLLLVILLIQALGINTSHQGLRQINSYFKEESDQVKSKAGMYKLFHYNVIPALNRVYWYNKKTPLPLEVSERKAVPDNPRFTSNVKGFTQDYTNKLVGVPRLRLLRLQKHKIKIAQTFQLITREAYGHYFQYREDKASYLPEWTKPEEWYGDISQLWNYTSMKYTKTGYNYGKTGWVYSGAGYVVPLSWNLGHSWRTITRLELEKWTDNATRAVFFEANLYNNDIKLYTELRFIIEVLANGVYTSRLMSRATSLFFATNADAQEIIILSLIMAVVLLVYALFVTSQISKESCQHYFSDLRGYFDVLILFLGFMVILHFFLRALTFSLFLDTLETAPHDTYTSLFTPFKIDEETHVLFGLFALITAMALALLTYQALWPKNFYFVFSAIYGLLLVIIAVNVTMSYLIHYTSYSVDREPLQIFFLQTVLRDQIYTVRGDEANTRLFYVFIFPLIVVLTKFNAACVIFLHLWYSEQTYERATRNRKKHSEREKSKKRGAVRLKGSSSARAKLSEDIIILRIEKVRVSFVTVLL